MELNDSQKFEALKLRFLDQVELLRVMTQLDLKIFTGYLTLQLAFGGWLSTTDIKSLLIKIGLLTIDLSLTGLASKLVYNSYRRRKEVVATLKNINDALNFNTLDYYIKDSKINATTKFRPWWYWYLIGIYAGFTGIVLIIFGL